MAVRNAQLIDPLSGEFQRRYEPNFAWKSACSAVMALPGLRGFWPMSAFESGGNAFDQSGNGRTLTYNGNPTYNYDGLAPYIDLDGTGDYLSRADEAGLDILGTEAYINATERGLSMGIWIYPTAVGALQAIIGKWDAGGNQRSYLIDLSAGNNFRAHVSVDGTADTLVTSTGTVAADNWYYVEMTYDPSTRLAINVNGTITQNVAAIPASIFNSNAQFNTGAQDNGGANLLTGRISMHFLCAIYHTDPLTQSVFHHTRAMYGV